MSEEGACFPRGPGVEVETCGEGLVTVEVETGGEGLDTGVEVGV